MNGEIPSLTLLLVVVAISLVEAWIPPQEMKHFSCAVGNSRRAAQAAATTCCHQLRAAFTKSDRNIVLAPSKDDPLAFDSFKIGNARVHRYSRQEDPDSETEYVMWYHGRSMELDQEMENKLPPLSTGRIGRATSRNGLVWEKDTTGSVSEDVKGVSLGLNKAEWWGFDTSHVGLGNVLLPMTTPAVLNDGGVYIMYYMGGDHQEQRIDEFVERELPEAMKDATIKGMAMKIGVAVSQDGITWGKVEGDDPSGACLVPFQKQDRTIDRTSIPSDMPEELYCAWPEVVVNSKGSIKSEGFIMYYSTMTKETKKKCIARAVSPDGFRWIKKGICLTPTDSLDKDDSGGGWDSNGCARCCVIPTGSFVGGAMTTTTSSSRGGWTMYYEGVSAQDNKHRILQAVSVDGAKWTKVGIALDIGSTPDDWDHGGVGAPHIIRMDDGTMRMYYTGQSAKGETAIGVAKLTVESGAWERELANFALVV